MQLNDFRNSNADFHNSHTDFRCDLRWLSVYYAEYASNRRVEYAGDWFHYRYGTIFVWNKDTIK